MKISKIRLPKYSHKQEFWNSLTHFVGILFSLAITITFVIYNIKYQIPFRVTYPFYIYTLTMFIVFFVSTFYHSTPLNTKKRAICRIIDHSDIFLFVAGTYTPIVLLAISNRAITISLLVIEWVFALIGVLITALWFNHKSISVIGYIIYLLAGWALIFVYPFNQCLPFDVFLFVLLGGVVYTVGAIIYAIGKKIIWFHTLFHVFILVAAVLQYIGIWYIFASLF